MKNIKIIKYCIDDYIDDYKFKLDSETEWTAVTDEDYEFIKNNIILLKTYDIKYVIFEQLSDDEISLTINKLKELISVEEKKQAKLEAEIEKRNQVAEEKKRKKELKILEKLKMKYE